MARKDDDFPEAASLDWLHGKKDPAHIETDKAIDDLTARFQEQYQKAQDDITEKLNKFYEKFAKDDSEMRALLKAGEITKERYAEWRQTKMLTGQRWKDLRDRIAQDYVDANTTARNMILNEMPNVYAINHNYAGYMIERQARIDTSWTLYNRRSVENLVKNDDILLPFPRTESKTAQMLRERMDLIWNRQHLANTMAQGIMQGESIYDIAERLQKITDMNKAVAVRNARTMMTATQNKARNDSFEELREKGVEISEYWLATLDGFTRHSHRMLHGEEKDQETGEYSNGLRYPADPYGKPAEVYNCRCSEIGMPKGFPPDIPKWSSGMGNLSFEEWQDMKTTHVENYVRKTAVKQEKFDAWKHIKQNGITVNDMATNMDSVAFKEFYQKVREGARNEHIRPEEYFARLREGEFSNPELVKWLQNNTEKAMYDDPNAYKLMQSLKRSKIESIPLAKLDAPKSEAQFIKDVAGGDLTTGSCASLSWCYAANQAGYDVRDFRGGKSQDYFADWGVMRQMANMSGVDGITERTQKPLKTVLGHLETMEEGKRYVLGCGGHAAVVRRLGDGFQYLELQDPSDCNGWYNLDAKELGWRFGCTKTSKYERNVILIDVDKLAQNENLPTIVSYINTAEGNERKGIRGGRK